MSIKNGYIHLDIKKTERRLWTLKQILWKKLLL